MTQATTTEVVLPPKASGISRILGMRKRMLVAMLMLIIAALAAIFANVLAPKPPAHAEVIDSFIAPQWFGGEYFLGTDQIGRDILSRLLFGLRTSLLVGVLSVLISAAIGVTLGVIAGYVGSFVDFIIMRLVDFQMSVPGILLIVLLAFVIGPGLETTIIVLGIAGWVAYARMARAEVKVVNNQTYIEAAHSVGASPMRVVLLHTLPNIVNSLVVLSVLQFGGVIISEAAVSFLGFGVQSPDSSLGIMISDGRAYINIAWWIPLFPGIAIFLLVLCAHLFGEALQDWTDPVRRRR